jgi:hypothetical protein
LLVWLIVGILTFWVLMLAATWVRNRADVGREMVATADVDGLRFGTGALDATLRWENPREVVWIPLRAFADEDAPARLIKLARSRGQDGKPT